MSPTASMYSTERDFPNWLGPPRLFYVLASTPRSGSTLLSVLLWRTGVLGAPLEYLSLQNNWFNKELACKSADDYWRELITRRTAPNGIFGIKLFPGMYNGLAQRAPSLLPRLAPDQVIHLTRRDTVAQAVSLYKAQATKSWFHDIPHTSVPEYSFEAIARCDADIQQQEDAWAKIFALTNCNPLEVEYDSIITNPTLQLARIAKFLGVDDAFCTESPLPIPKVQADALSLEWIERYRNERRKRYGALPIPSLA